MGSHSRRLPGRGGERRAGRPHRHLASRVPPGASSSRGRPGQPLLIYLRLERPRANLAVARRALATRARSAPEPVPHPRAIRSEAKKPLLREVPRATGGAPRWRWRHPRPNPNGDAAPAPGGGPAAAAPTHRRRPRRHPGEPGAGADRAAEPAAPAHRGGAATRGTSGPQPAVPVGAAMGRRRQHDATPAHGVTATEIRSRRTPLSTVRLWVCRTRWSYPSASPMTGVPNPSNIGIIPCTGGTEQS